MAVTTSDRTRSLRASAPRLVLLAVAVATLTTAPPAAAARSIAGQSATAQTPDQPGEPDGPVDCRGPVDDAEPGTPEWDELNAANAYARESTSATSIVVIVAILAAVVGALLAAGLLAHRRSPRNPSAPSR